MGYQLFAVATPPVGVVTPDLSCCRIRIALGLIVLFPGAVGTVLLGRPNPHPNHSVVTPTHCCGLALFRYSTRSHAPSPLAGGLFVISPSRGHVAQAYGALVVWLIGGIQLFVAAFAMAKY